MSSHPSPSRRQFLQSSVAVAGTLAAAGQLSAHVAGGDTLRIGLIGCGGRGTGAAEQGPERRPTTSSSSPWATCFPRTASTKLPQAISERVRRPRSTCRRNGIHRLRRLQAGHRQRRRRAAVPRRPASGRCTSRPPSRRASTSSARSRWPSTAPASARSSSRPRQAKEKNLASSRASATATSRRSARRSSGSTTARSATSSPSTPTTTPAPIWHVDRARRACRTWNGRCATGTTSPGSRGDHIVEQHIHNIDKAAWVLKDDRTRSRRSALGGRQVAHRARSSATSSTTTPSSSSTPTA